MTFKLAVDHYVPFIYVKVVKNVPGMGDDKSAVLPVNKPLVLLKQL